jgi:hypothetical protein
VKFPPNPVKMGEIPPWENLPFSSEIGGEKFSDFKNGNLRRIFTWRRISLLISFDDKKKERRKFVGSHCPPSWKRSLLLFCDETIDEQFSSFRVHLHVKRVKIVRKIYFPFVALYLRVDGKGQKFCADKIWSQFSLLSWRLKLFCRFHFTERTFRSSNPLQPSDEFSHPLFSTILEPSYATVQTWAFHLPQFSPSARNATSILS